MKKKKNKQIFLDILRMIFFLNDIKNWHNTNFSSDSGD